jgi:hypothetical protein
MDYEPQNKRQYDRSTELVQAVKVLVLMPDEVRSIISEGIIAMIQQEFEEAMQLKHYRSLGAYTVLSLHKTQNRRRDYDQNPVLHKAISRLYILSESRQDDIGRHIRAMVEIIKEYFDTCEKLQRDVSMEDVANITTRYIEEGSTEALAFLQMLKTEFIACLKHKPVPNGKPETPVEIATDNQGMRVHKLEIE